MLGQPEVKALLSDENFTGDGTLIGAWASMHARDFRSIGRAAQEALRRRAIVLVEQDA